MNLITWGSRLINCNKNPTIKNNARNDTKSGNSGLPHITISFQILQVIYINMYSSIWEDTSLNFDHIRNGQKQTMNGLLLLPQVALATIYTLSLSDPEKFCMHMPIWISLVCKRYSLTRKSYLNMCSLSWNLYLFVFQMIILIYSVILIFMD